MNFFVDIICEALNLFKESSLFILFGIVVGGLLKIFLSPSFVAKHLGKGKFKPVLKAALFGIPIPLCSCGVLPAAASLKKQGANNGATTAFLISTPESGVDSIAISYALLDPLLTVARPVVAFITALTAGFLENLFHTQSDDKWQQISEKICPIDGACNNELDNPPQESLKEHHFFEKLMSGLRYAVVDLWGDLAGWFFAGLLLAGLITTLVPQEFMIDYLGAGLAAKFIMLIVGIPMYICATASTPIAAAFILKGMSPGTALVFLLVGPATNITSISVLIGILGKRASLLYLIIVSLVAVVSGSILDGIYEKNGLSAMVMAGQATEFVPESLKTTAAIVLLILSISPLWKLLRNLKLSVLKLRFEETSAHNESNCGCDNSLTEKKNKKNSDHGRVKTCDRF